MEAHIIKTEALTKKYGKFVAVNNLDLNVYETDIYGFLGLNGAGKTTTIRMLLGLIKPTSGRIFILGKEFKRNFLEIMNQVGALVENPVYYPHISGYENLKIIKLLSKSKYTNGDKDIKEVLEILGLAQKMHDKVRTYSQGMKQRLAIAMSLLSFPRLAILDEPTNGLDPIGIKHVRDLIIHLNKTRGMTFFISSHLLHEVETTCTRVGIIKDGVKVVEDDVKHIVQQTINGVYIRANPKELTIQKLRALEWVEIIGEHNGDIHVKIDEKDFARLNAELVKQGLEISRFEPVHLSLEEYFSRIVK